MQESTCRKVFDLISEIMLKDWKHFIYRVIYVPGGYDMSCYIDMGDGVYTDAFNVINNSKIVMVYHHINAQVYPELNEELGHRQQAVFVTISGNSDGTYEVDQQFVSPIEHIIDYLRTWDETYIKVPSVSTTSSYGTVIQNLNIIKDLPT